MITIYGFEHSRKTYVLRLCLEVVLYAYLYLLNPLDFLKIIKLVLALRAKHLFYNQYKSE